MHVVLYTILCIHQASPNTAQPTLAKTHAKAKHTEHKQRRQTYRAQPGGVCQIYTLNNNLNKPPCNQTDSWRTCKLTDGRCGWVTKTGYCKRQLWTDEFPYCKMNQLTGKTKTCGQAKGSRRPHWSHVRQGQKPKGETMLFRSSVKTPDTVASRSQGVMLYGKPNCMPQKGKPVMAGAIGHLSELQLPHCCWRHCFFFSMVENVAFIFCVRYRRGFISLLAAFENTVQSSIAL